MKRRTLLGSVSVSVAPFAGCLSAIGTENGESDDGDDDSADEPAGDDDSADEPDGESTADVDYERCENRIVSVSNVPEPAADEATTAVDDGEYETDGELLLPEVIAVDDAYLSRDDEYYRAEIAENADATILRLTEAVPVFAEPVTLENVTDETVSVTLTVTREESDEVVLEEADDLEPADRIVLNEDVEFHYGTYRMEVDGDDLSEDGTWDLTWELDQRFESGYEYPIELDDHGVFEDPVDRDSTHGPCSWTDDGEVRTG
ncbi:hypothetical protein [Natrarchaeobius oligotrophus]|uniref:hypothetical protein n=1 Tax=Natrarchaeobius oligotrophus TaxID=3455743 RepID=UPI000F5299C5|nr:hypothetical protein [Natrarchaeobius chitinivorans]